MNPQNQTPNTVEINNTQQPSQPADRTSSFPIGDKKTRWKAAAYYLIGNVLMLPFIFNRNSGGLAVLLFFVGLLLAIRGMGLIAKAKGYSIWLEVVLAFLGIIGILILNVLPLKNKQA